MRARYWACGAAALLACTLVWLTTSAAGEKSGPLLLTQRSRIPSPQEKGVYVTSLKQVEWEPRQTAVIVCDMWDSHHSLNAVRRVEEIAPRMNQVLEKARSLGMLIIHAPSSSQATAPTPGMNESSRTNTAIGM